MFAPAHCRWSTRSASLLLALAAVVGCHDDGLNRTVVEGSVSLKNVPAEVGQIRFIPQDDTLGPITIAPIHQGKYRCDLNGGVPVGKHRVEILIWDPAAPKPNGPGSKPRPQWAPKEFNKQSTLTAVIESAEYPVVQDFNL